MPINEDTCIFKLKEYRLIQNSTLGDSLSMGNLKTLFSKKRKSGLLPKDFLAEGLLESDILFAHENKDSWLAIARSEWKHTKTSHENQTKPCDLCTRAHIVMCYVKNIKNGRIINVGGNCVKLFGDELSRRHLNGAKSEKELLNLGKIQEVIPKIKSLSANWSRFQDEIFVIPSNRLMNKYLQIGDKIEDTLKRGIKESNNDSEIKELQELIESGNVVKKKIEKFSSENLLVQFILNRPLFEEMKRSQPNDYRKIKDTIVDEHQSRITWGTAHRIKAPSFLEAFKEAFNDNSTSINIMELRSGKYLIKFNELSSLYFQINTSSFIFNCGDIVFSPDDASTHKERIDGMLDDLKAYGRTSIEQAIKLISSELEHHFKYKRYNPRNDFDLNGSIRKKLSQVDAHRTMKNEVKDMWAKLDRIKYEAQQITLINDMYLNFLWNYYQDESFNADKEYAKIIKLCKEVSDIEEENMLSILANPPKKLLIFNKAEFIVYLQKIKGIYDKIGRFDISQNVKLLERNIDFTDKSSADLYQKIRATDVFKSDIELDKEEEKLNDSIINFDRYKGTAIEFIDSDSNMIISVEKEKFCQQGLPLVFSEYINKKASLDKLKDFLSGVKKLTKEQYRKNMLVSIESSKLEIY